METIKNYLETMFQNLPDTPEVQKAKAELLSMMEDKYTELISDGHTENEAIGTVISEFGNLDELADDLGIVNLLRPAGSSFTDEPANDQLTVPQKILPADDAAGFLRMQKYRAILTALGVFLCITCAVPVILLELGGSESAETAGVACLLVMIAVAVALFINAGIQAGKYSYIKKEGYVLDAATAADLADRKDKFRTTYALLLSAGVVCCILSVVPAVVLETMPVSPDLADALSGISVLLIVGIGVFLIVMSNIMMGGLTELLEQNGAAGQASHTRGRSGKDKEIHYTNPTVAAIMSVYWPTVTCVYLMWSFITFDWHVTWILWPVTGIFKRVIDNIWAEKNI